MRPNPARAMLDFSRIQYLTFDCYGTLIDWESGILKAIRPVLAVHGVRATDRDIIDLYARLERERESAEYMCYRDVLRHVMMGFADRYSLALQERELSRLPESIARWEPFPDTREALARLGARCGLVITSNIDLDLFEASRQKLGVEFEYTVTADLCRSYKPRLKHWHVALALMGVAPDRVLHVAQSLFHDIEPAQSLGIPCVHVNRHGAAGTSASGAPENPNIHPDCVVPDLASLADQFDRA